MAVVAWPLDCILFIWLCSLECEWESDDVIRETLCFVLLDEDFDRVRMALKNILLLFVGSVLEGESGAFGRRLYNPSDILRFDVARISVYHDWSCRRYLIR